MLRSTFIKTKYNHSQVNLENSDIKITIIPEFGGKIFELIRKDGDIHYLYRPDKDLNLIKKPQYGIEFVPPYDFGFDECFPTVSPSSYKMKGKCISIPDHGELWNRAWEYEIHNDSIHLQITGERLKYLFKKKIILDKHWLSIHYSLTNLESVPFQYIWSSHPLLVIDPDDEFIISDEIDEVLINWSSNANYGKYGDKVSWPRLGGKRKDIDFSRVQSKILGLAIKVFSDKLEKGLVGLYRHKSNTSVVFHFDEKIIPYLGMWLCYGGWPQNSYKQAYTVALEPTSGRPDCLSDGIKRNEVSLINPAEEKTWTLSISITNGKYEL